MEEGVIETDIDQLLDLLKKKDKLPMEEVATQLKVPIEVVQTWIDFLVEEGIIGIEYKFTKPSVFLIREKKEVLEDETGEYSWERAKKNFYMEALEKNISEKEIKDLWKSRINDLLESKKSFFYVEANRRTLKNVDALWEEYKNKVMGI